jgi:hypothetical protein
MIELPTAETDDVTFLSLAGRIINGAVLAQNAIGFLSIRRTATNWPE